eukprot:GFYU01010920.1.p1 GENE.GFYU01010920.1~~GFYU01010920.1.p1  ORF type:complete len:422 (-),score=92.88 GFYU01010920.1:74-1339(-)
MSAARSIINSIGSRASVTRSLHTYAARHEAVMAAPCLRANPSGHRRPSVNHTQTRLLSKPSISAASSEVFSFVKSKLGMDDPSAQSSYSPEFTSKVTRLINPHKIVADEMATLAGGIDKLVGSQHPVLDEVAKYLFSLGGKRIRPLVVLLFAKASAEGDAGILRTQQRLAMITEMIHTASLVHDDVIDLAETRRGYPSVNSTFGNKTAVLAGDFLLARASLELARMRNVEVIELLSLVIEHLSTGEMMQMRAPKNDRASFEYYLQKNFYKTASLIAHSSKASIILGKENYSAEMADNAFEYGKNIGLMFQLVDDVLDYVGNEATMGKPSLGDLKAGIATAPAFYAAEQFPTLVPLIERQFSEDGDVEMASELILKSDGIERTRQLAAKYCTEAQTNCLSFPQSEATDALIMLTEEVLKRNK